MKKVLIISFLIFTILAGYLNISYAFASEEITEENADYVLNLKVNQKCKIETNTQVYGYHDGVGTDILDIEYNDKEITARETGNCSFYLQVGKESKLFFVTVEANAKNEVLEPVTLKIENVEDIIPLGNITKEDADYFIELNVGESHEFIYENYSSHDLLYGDITSINFEYDYDTSKIKITALKEDIVRGYLYQNVDIVKEKLHYIYISVTDNKDLGILPPTVDTDTDDTTNNNNNNDNNNTNNNISTKPTGPSIKEVLIVPPTKTRYDVGESLDLTGLTITVVYSNDKIEEVTKGYTVTGYNKNKEGIQTVTISYKGFSRTYNVKVGNSSEIVDFNEIEKLPQTGDFFDLKDGLYVLISLLSLALIYIVCKSIKYGKTEK